MVLKISIPLKIKISAHYKQNLFWNFLAFVQENSWDNGKSCLNELSKEQKDIQYNYDFHLHHQLVDESQMFGELQSFYYNRNVHNMPRYEKPNFLPAPHLIWYIDSQIPGKGFLIVLRKSNEGRRKFLFLYPRYMNFLTFNYPLQYSKRLVI